MAREDRPYNASDPLSPSGVWAGLENIADATHSERRPIRWRARVLWAILAFPFMLAGVVTAIDLADRAFS
jgi:hypothetical protein